MGIVLFEMRRFVRLVGDGVLRVRLRSSGGGGGAVLWVVWLHVGSGKEMLWLWCRSSH